MKCPSCGTDNLDTARSCRCGHKFSSSFVREARRRAAGQSNPNEGAAFHDYTRREAKSKPWWRGRSKARKQTAVVSHDTAIPLTEIQNNGCWFCDKGGPQSDTGLQVKMSVPPGYVRIKDIESGIPTYEAQNPSATVVVPRCPTCKKAHERWLAFGAIGMASGFLLGMSGCSLVLYTDSAELGIGKAFLMGLAISAGSIIFWFLVGALIGAVMPPPKGIKRASYGRKHHDVQRLEQQGWQVDRLETAG